MVGPFILLGGGGRCRRIRFRYIAWQVKSLDEEAALRGGFLFPPVFCGKDCLAMLQGVAVFV
jgi:hypothetical protein